MVSAGIISAALFFGAGSALAADAAEGEFVFGDNCGICHSAEQGGGHKIGPNLFGIVGRQSGTAEGFANFSQAMKDADINWSGESLGTFLDGPAAMIPGTIMGFPGFSNEADKANLLAYLESLH
nr:MAG: c-type cytochrome [Hyphomicrobiales bacterium]